MFILPLISSKIGFIEKISIANYTFLIESSRNISRDMEDNAKKI